AWSPHTGTGSPDGIGVVHGAAPPSLPPPSPPTPLDVADELAVTAVLDALTVLLAEPPCPVEVAESPPVELLRSMTTLPPHAPVATPSHKSARRARMPPLRTGGDIKDCRRCGFMRRGNPLRVTIVHISFALLSFTIFPSRPCRKLSRSTRLA